MAKRLLSQTIFNTKYVASRATPDYIRINQYRELHTHDIPTKEIQIPVHWGHIAAKLWGEDQGRPILALHGWQDNAGTWDTLAPMLCKNRSILAIDFPGHGLSSWIPPGMQYYPWELPRLIHFIKQYFKWDKVSILGHSMGSIAGMRFSCLFPDDVDFYVGIDNLVAEDFNLELAIEKYPDILKKMKIAESRLTEEPPSYMLEEIKKLWHLGTRKSVDLESVQHLLHRGAKQSKKDPNKYFISRDPRLKHMFFNPEDKTFVITLVKRLKCPTLYFKAMDSPYAIDEYPVEMRNLIEKNNDKYESHFLPGTHHLHLNNPEKLAPIIIDFVRKHNLQI